MSITDELLLFLSNSPGNYGRLREHMLQRVAPNFENQEKSKRNKKRSNVSDNCLRATLSRLKQRGLLDNQNGLWKITNLGQTKLGRSRFFKKYSAIKQAKPNRKIIIAFDIPESRKKDRNWLRLELITLGFKKLQQSVWVGPAPLPKEFVEFLKVAKISPFLKFFEVKETDII